MSQFDDIYSNGADSLTFVEHDDDLRTQESNLHHYGDHYDQQSQLSTALKDTDFAQDATDLEFNEDIGEESEPARPEHACAYCGIHDPKCVANCLKCKRWFCNGKGLAAGSHIVTHLVRSGHKEVCTHRDSSLGETTLECYTCGARNVFQLGYIAASKDSYIVIVCRTPCAQQRQDNEWEGDGWKPLINERSFLKWLIGVPDPNLQQRAKKVGAGQMAQLEEIWKTNPTATMDEINRKDFDRDLDAVQLQYHDSSIYCHIFTQLIDAEANYDKAIAESQTQSVGRVRWEPGLNKEHIAYFYLPRVEEGSMKVTIGDELRLKHCMTVDKGWWCCPGQVIKAPDNHSDEIGLRMYSSANMDFPTDSRINYTCEVVWNSTPFDRMRSALKRLNSDPESVSNYIYHKLMGHDVDEIMFRISLPSALSAPGLPELNHSQMHAVKTVLQRPLSLIQGPPGTGKTVTSATIVYHLVTNGRERQKVLVCAPSNIAVDQLAERIHRTGVKVVRLTAKCREALDCTVEFLKLSVQLMKMKGAAELQKLQMLKEEIGELSISDEKRYNALKNTKEQQLLAAADVICCTCSSAADPRLQKLSLKCILIDESTQATEPEVIVPLVRGVRQLILVGDHFQLGPVVLSKKAAMAGFGQSLFERLVLLKNRPIRLQVQYRMHPSLSAFPSNVFYEGSLQNGVTERDRTLKGIDWQFPVPDKPMMFWTCYGKEELAASGVTYLNRTEAANVEKLASKLITAGMNPTQIGIITPYEGQRAFLVNYLHSHGTLSSKLYEEIEIANVDAFQGREKDVIIFTCVRSNETGGIGFLRDPRRMNVAITRAKYGLIIIGNAKVLTKQPLWLELLTHFKERKLIFEGALNNLMLSQIQLPQLKLPANNSDMPLTRFGLSHQRHMYPASDIRPGSYAPILDASAAVNAQTLRQQNAQLPVPIHAMSMRPTAAMQNMRASRIQPNARHKPVAAWPPLGSAKEYTQQSDSFISQESQDIYGDSVHPFGSQSSASQSQTQGFSQGWSRSGVPNRLSHLGHHDASQAESTSFVFSQDVENDMAKLMLSQGEHE